MEPARYLESIERDGVRLASVARGVPLDAPIPSCPGWTVRECVAHTAEVYQHKIACMRLVRRPGDDYEQEPRAGVDVLGWFDRSLTELLQELRMRGPAAQAYTWWPADQTVGFWYRRMAQETAIHRLDVEDAASAATAIDSELALDGIDEVLELFLGGDWDEEVSPEEWGDVDPHAGEGQTIAVRSGGRAWRCTLGAARIAFARAGTGATAEADASVSGEPESVLLWLWGRRPDASVTLGGDQSALGALRDRLWVATQ